MTFDAIEWMVMTMADVNVMRDIFCAIKAGDVDFVVSLIGHDKSKLAMMTPFGTWLHVAASAGQLDIVKRLLKMGADLNAYGGTFGGNPLHTAASDGHLEIVKFLIDVGGKLDVSKPERNPLFSAILGGHTKIAKWLIDKGIDSKIKYTGKNMKNMDAREFAREWGRSEIIAYLDEQSHSSARAPARENSKLKSKKIHTKTLVNLDVLRRRIAAAARRAFKCVQAAVSLESVYAFALYTADDAVLVNSSANTETAYTRICENLGDKETRTQVDLIGNYRWSPYEWAYEGEGSEHFEKVNNLINNRGQGNYDHDDPEGFIAFKAGVMASMVLALKDLKAEGCFKGRTPRKSTTLYCSIPNSEATAWFERDSARRLNPKKVYEQFLNERIGYLLEDGDEEISINDDPLYIAYRLHFQSS